MEEKSPFASPLFSARSITVIMVVAVIGYLLGVSGLHDHTHPDEGIEVPAPVVTLPRLNGGEETVPGPGWRLVHFWATWCGPCVAELPTLQTMAFDMAGTIWVTTVNVDDLEAGSVAHWMGRKGISLPTLLDRTGVAQRGWGVVSLPTSYLVNPDGMVVGRADGARDWTDESVKAFLGEKMGG